MKEKENRQKYPKLEDAKENEELVEKTEAPWKWLIFCGVILVLIVACIIVVFSIK